MMNTNEKKLTTMMTYNIFVGSNSYFSKPNDRAPYVEQMIRKYNPDIAGVQEASTVWMKELKARLSDKYEMVGFGRDSEMNEDGTLKQTHGEAQYILYSKDKFELLDTTTEWLSATPAVPQSKYEGQAYLRVVTWAHLRRKEDGKEFVHCNTHLDFERKLQVKEVIQIVERMEKYQEAGTPVIITGDFNMAPDAPAFKLFENFGYISALDKAEKKGIVGKTCPSNEEKGMLIDHLMSNSVVEAKYYTVCKDLFDGKEPSDHHPVYVEFAF